MQSDTEFLFHGCSAASFGQGAFPDSPALPIPVYSSPPPDDWIIRAYENCPEYLDRVNAFFECVC